MTGTVERVAVSKTDAQHRRAAELVKRNGRLNRELAAYFAEIADVAEALHEEGSVWLGPVYEPLVEAAASVWRSSGPTETRIEVHRLTEAPLMEIEE